jgi:hypothetical protein
MLSQVYVEGENGTVFLISADDEAVLVAVAAKGAKVGLMLFEVRRAAAAVAEALRVELDYGQPADELPAPAPLQVVSPAPAASSDRSSYDPPFESSHSASGAHAAPADSPSWS